MKGDEKNDKTNYHNNMGHNNDFRINWNDHDLNCPIIQGRFLKDKG